MSSINVPAKDPGLPDPPILTRIREGVIGDDQVMWGPFGARRVTYADYTASGRALSFIEDVILHEVLPRYANTHTESSGTGLQTTRLREDARRIIARAVNGDDDTCVIFCGSGSTAAINRLIGILNLRIPADLDRRYGLSDAIPASERPVVFIGPFEHHSNELSPSMRMRTATSTWLIWRSSSSATATGRCSSPRSALRATSPASSPTRTA